MRLLIYIAALVLIACNNDSPKEETQSGFAYGQFEKQFKTATLPFQLSDSFLLKNKDTATLWGQGVDAFFPDSLRIKLFGEKEKVKYTPLYNIKVSEEEQYYIVKGEASTGKAALLMAFVKGEFVASFPFLAPDLAPGTFQQSSIDKAFSISKNISLKSGDVTAEGKEVYVFNKDAKSFTLIMTDPLDEKSIDLANPIDTLAKTNKWAGDYSKDKRNVVSVRDGRKPGFLTVYVHIEKEDNCNGELKGDAQITSPTTAIYRQGGDPCVLQFNFEGSLVKLTEIEGCGSRRGLECSFNGSFSKKKPAKPKAEKAIKKKTVK